LLNSASVVSAAIVFAVAWLLIETFLYEYRNNLCVYSFSTVSKLIVHMKTKTLFYSALALVAGQISLFAGQHSSDVSSEPKVSERTFEVASSLTLGEGAVVFRQHSEAVAKGKVRKSARDLYANRAKGEYRLEKSRLGPLSNGASANPKARSRWKS